MNPIPFDQIKPGEWIGFDFDGTLVEYVPGRIYRTEEDIGSPILAMVNLATTYLNAGVEVRILTARAANYYPDQKVEAVDSIKQWCLTFFGKAIPVTASKDPMMRAIYDDRAIQIITNEGKTLQESLEGSPEDRPGGIPTVPDLLRAAAKTYEQRNALYGNGYKEFGHSMEVMFPNGLTIKDPEDWNRLAMVMAINGKLHRYCASFAKGGHKDSAHDLCVYAAMMEELTND